MTPPPAVSIWMACLDHRGRLVEDVRAQVAVHDPSNAIVQYWNIHQPQHSEGRVVNLLFQLSDAPPIGQWTVRATAGDLTASQTFQLTDKRLGSGLITPHNELSNPPEDNTGALLVEPHFVQLDFSPRTASVVRQGSPFAGEVDPSSHPLLFPSYPDAGHFLSSWWLERPREASPWVWTCWTSTDPHSTAKPST